MNAVEPFESLRDWVRTAAVDAAPPRPPELAARTFTWTGGGRGPVPPVEP